MTHPQLSATPIPSPLGTLIAVQDAAGALLELEFDPARLRTPDPRCHGADEVRARPVATALARYFAGELRELELPVSPFGTDFQLRVWEELRRIPYGTTISYAELARRVGDVKAVRAVGRANGANPIAIVVPCHRVIGADGTLTGYAGGLERKRALLALEARHAGRPVQTTLV